LVHFSTSGLEHETTAFIADKVVVVIAYQASSKMDLERYRQQVSSSFRTFSVSRPSQMDTAAKRVIRIHYNNRQEGPYAEEEIRKMLADGVIARHTLAWKEGMKDWIPLYTLLPDIPPPIPSPISAPIFPFPQARPTVYQPTSYPGIGRLAYLGWNLVLGFALGVAIAMAGVNPNTPSPGAGAVSLLVMVLAFVPVALRLQNIGRNPWWCLLLLVPIANLFVSVPCLIAPPGYAYTKKLDTAGKIIVWSILGLLALLVLVGLITAAFS
jgi:uncharacterized membrane protein YhaH (DUF805 family)